jgi:hypothetical protein
MENQNDLHFDLKNSVLSNCNKRLGDEIEIDPFIVSG